jgi:CheY-like chemotaxis protein
LLKRWRSSRQRIAKVLISDIGLPDGTGWELLEKARLPRPIYAIAMSGFSFNDASIRSHSVGYRHHLLKPFTPADLKGILVEAAREVRLYELIGRT